MGGILVIKLGALGDFTQACGPFQAIRDYHVNEKITLLTTEPFFSMALASNYFDDVWVDERPAVLDWLGWLRLRRRLQTANFRRVYDLQTSDRTAIYYRLFGRASVPEWSGIARRCSHPHKNPSRDQMHTLDRQSEQLAVAGINNVPPPNLDWFRSDLGRFKLPNRYALLVPGGAPGRRNKRWSARQFGELANKLVKTDVRVFLIGQKTEGFLHSQIALEAEGVISLAGKTTLADVAELGRCTVVSVGNDTGPMHILATGGHPTFVLFGDGSDPSLCAPRGENVECLISNNHGDIRNLSVNQVWAAIAPSLG